MALHGAIDDATGIVTAAIFRPTEDLWGYLMMMEKGIRQYGVPLALYSDQHTIFFSPQTPLSIEQEVAGETDVLTQFGAALSELGIEHIRARTPQAKGRIERLWETFQGRLLIELRIRHVCTLVDANAVLDELVAKHNHQFAVRPEDSESAYRPAPDDMPLAHRLCRRETRMVTPAQTVSYHRTVYRLEATISHSLPARTTVQVRQTMQGILVVYHEGVCYSLHPMVSAPRANQASTPAVVKSGPKTPPAADHPWRTYKTPPKQRTATTS